MWYYINNLCAVITPVIVILFSHLMGKIWSMIGGELWTMKEHTIKFVHMFFFVVGIQFLGFGLAGEVSFSYHKGTFFITPMNCLGILRRFLVWPSSEVWPSNFPTIALLRVLHHNQLADMGKISRSSTSLLFCYYDCSIYFLLVSWIYNACSQWFVLDMYNQTRQLSSCSID
jgi:hypothetical protein